MPERRQILLGTVAGITALAGCGGDSSPNNQNSSDATPDNQPSEESDSSTATPSPVDGVVGEPIEKNGIEIQFTQVVSGQTRTKALTSGETVENEQAFGYNIEVTVTGEEAVDVRREGEFEAFYRGIELEYRQSFRETAVGGTSLEKWPEGEAGVATVFPEETISGGLLVEAPDTEAFRLADLTLRFKPKDIRIKAESGEQRSEYQSAEPPANATFGETVTAGGLEYSVTGYTTTNQVTTERGRTFEPESGDGRIIILTAEATNVSPGPENLLGTTGASQAGEPLRPVPVFREKFTANGTEYTGMAYSGDGVYDMDQAAIYPEVSIQRSVAFNLPTEFNSDSFEYETNGTVWTPK